MPDLISPAVRRAVGRPYPPIVATIGEKAVRRYCRAVGRPFDGRVPWLFLASLGADQAPPSTRADGLSGRATSYPLDIPLERSVVGGQEWDFARRPRLGETLTIDARDDHRSDHAPRAGPLDQGCGGPDARRGPGGRRRARLTGANPGSRQAAASLDSLRRQCDDAGRRRGARCTAAGIT
jgi:hypothetical protein